MELNAYTELKNQLAAMDREALEAEAASAMADRDTWRAMADRRAGKIAAAEEVLTQLVKDGEIDTTAAAALAEALEVSITRRVDVEMTITVTGYLELELGEDVPENKWDWEIDRLVVSADGTELQDTEHTITHIDASEADE
jgi:hypothetical protein